MLDLDAELRHVCDVSSPGLCLDDRHRRALVFVTAHVEMIQARVYIRIRYTRYGLFE